MHGLSVLCDCQWLLSCCLKHTLSRRTHFNTAMMVHWTRVVLVLAVATSQVVADCSITGSCDDEDVCDSLETYLTVSGVLRSLLSSPHESSPRMLSLSADCGTAPPADAGGRHGPSRVLLTCVIDWQSSAFTHHYNYSSATRLLTRK
jgi:hypothetical protein